MGYSRINNFCVDCGKPVDPGLLICEACVTRKADLAKAMNDHALHQPILMLYDQQLFGSVTVRVRVYQYRSDRSTGKQGFIAGYTGLFPGNWGTPPYQHTEVGIEVAKDVFVVYSSTTRNRTDDDAAANGVRKILERDLLNHPENWDIYEKRVTIQEAVEMLIRAEAINNTGSAYDWGGIGGFGALGFANDPFKWYCSEEGYYILFGVHKKTVSPRRMTVYIIKDGFVLIREGTTDISKSIQENAA